jgi:DNA-binding XRE family transcriptional regulator
VDREEFLRARKKLGKTQEQLAQLLATSLKAVHSWSRDCESAGPCGASGPLFGLYETKD